MREGMYLIKSESAQKSYPLDVLSCVRVTYAQKFLAIHYRHHHVTNHCKKSRSQI